MGEEKEWAAFLGGMWKALQRKQVYLNWPLGPAEGLFSKPGIFDDGPLEEYLGRELKGLVKSDRMISISEGLTLWAGGRGKNTFSPFFPSVVLRRHRPDLRILEDLGRASGYPSTA